MASLQAEVPVGAPMRANAVENGSAAVTLG